MRVHRRRSWLLLGLLVLAGNGQSGAPVRPGIDVLLEDSLHLVAGRRVGLLTNQAGVDRLGRDGVTRLRAGGVSLTAIFSPEHGYRGVLDVENIGHGVDSATGLPVFSLYGAERAPTAGMLALVDVLLVDLQDVGARPYTYVSTTLLALRAAATVGVRLVVLDRPNPVGGMLVQGPMLDTSVASFVGMLPVPLRHGMTIGELARLGTDVLGIAGDLVVVPAAGWRRSLWFEETGLPWVAPSPSMPSVESATHYPGTVLFEATNLSVGRGTPIAFQVVGAPWLDAAAVAAALAGEPGVTATDTTVVPERPSDRKYPGARLAAVRLTVTDRQAYDPVRAAARLLLAVRRRHGDSLVLDSARFDRLAGSSRLRVAVARALPVDSIVAGWNADLERFRHERVRYLLY